MLEVLKENHIRTFRAFGMHDRLIALRYALPIAIVPVVSVLGVGIGSLLSGAVLTKSSSSGRGSANWRSIR